MSIQMKIMSSIYESAKNILDYSNIDVKFKFNVIDLIINNKIDLFNIFSQDVNLNKELRDLIGQIAVYDNLKNELNKKIIDLILIDIFNEEFFVKSDSISYTSVNKFLDDEDLSRFLDRELRKIIRKNQENLMKVTNYLDNKDGVKEFHNKESTALLDIYNFVEKYHDADHLLWYMNDIGSGVEHVLDESAKLFFKIGIIMAAHRKLEIVPVDRNKKTISPRLLQKDVVFDLVLSHQIIENKKNNLDLKYNQETTKNAQKEIAAILLLDILSSDNSNSSIYENLIYIFNNYGDDCIVEMRDILHDVDNFDFLKSKLYEQTYSKYSQNLLNDSLSKIEERSDVFLKAKHVFKEEYNHINLNNQFSSSIESHYANLSNNIDFSAKKNNYSSFFYSSDKIKKLSSNNKLSCSGSPCLKPVYRNEITNDFIKKY